MKPHVFIFIGRSGCGKGTQVNLLRPLLEAQSKTPVLYIETGDMFRKFIEGEGHSQHLSREAYEKNERQPDFLACFMWSTFLVRDFQGSSHIICDGTPRSLLEAKLLDTAFSFYQFEVKRVHIIHLDVSRAWAEKHLLARGRSDDATVATIGKRLNWFDKDVMPAIEYFKTSGHDFIEVNGEQSIEAVQAEIRAGLASIL